MTVVFADLVGFTTLAENLDPERVKRLVDVAFERLVHDVHEFGRRVDKIMGDGIVALFGAPVAHEDDAERAVRAGLRMHETLRDYAEETSIAIRMRIGINTGEVLVGALRAGGDYTAMGDVMNTASRLETSASPGEVLVGPLTYQATREVIGYESRGSVIVRGRDSAVDVWAAIEALVPPGYRPRRITPLVGRDAELSVLQHVVRLSVGNGRGQMIVLMGEAGVGKTRLANEIAPLVRAVDPAATVLNGRCVPYGEANPWWPIAEVLRDACKVEINDPPDVARNKCTQAVQFMVGETDAASGIVEGLLHLLGYDGPLRALDPSKARGEAAQALLAFLEAGVRVRPVLVRLADLHWADEHVLELIDNLSQHMARLPFVLVVTARRGLLDRWSPKAGRQNSLVMNLDPLTREASAELLETLLGDEVTDELRTMLLDRSGGNPFYLEELATLLSEGGSAPAENGSVSGNGSEVPDTLRGLVAARIDGLTADEQLTLEDASVWGASGPILVLSETARLMRDRHDVDDVVGSLAMKDIFVRDGDRWSFRSDIVREVAYARLTKSERMRRHHGMAKYLEDSSGGRFIDDGFVDMVSRHFGEAARLARELGSASTNADLDTRALRWLGEAARRSDQSGAWPLSARLYDQALDLASAPEHASDRMTFLVGRAHAHTEMWRLDLARADACEASEHAVTTDDAVGRARVALLEGCIESRDGNLTAAIERFDDAVGQFDALGDLQGRADALRQKGQAALFQNKAAEAELPIAESLVAFRGAGDRRGEAWALQNLAWIAFVTGRIEQAELRLSEAFDAFTEIGDAAGFAWTDGLLAFVRFSQGRFEEATEIARRIGTESERRNDRWGQAMMLILIGGVDLWQGRTADAVVTADRAVDLFSELGDAAGLEQAFGLAGRANLMAGSIHRGLALIDRVTAPLLGAPLAASGIAGAAMSLAARAQIGIEQLLDPADVVAHVGEVDPSDGRLAQLSAVAALAVAQRGDPERASTLFGDVESSDVAACRALVLAAIGRHAEVAELAGASYTTSTYLDRSMLDVAVGLGRGAGWDGRFASAVSEVSPTGDLLTRATVELARACAAEAEGDDRAPAWREDAEARWTDLGVDPVGWRVLFSNACATTPADQ